jgi:hypothetical protein
MAQVVHCTPVHVGFVVDKVAVEEVFVGVHWSSPVGIIPTVFHTFNVLTADTSLNTR